MPILRAKHTFFVILALAGCHNPPSDDIKPIDSDLPVVRGDQIEPLSLDVPSCQSSANATAHLRQATITLWGQGQLGQSIVELGALALSGNPLAGPSSDHILINSVFRRQCDSRLATPPQCHQEGNQSPGWALVTGGTPLKICDAASAPARHSIENQALVALVTVERASRLIRQHLPSGTNLPKLTILASPRFESHWTPWQDHGAAAAFEMLFADNLAYFAPTASTPPYLALLPASKDTAGGSKLWESPFVVAHEYGHHVEHALGVDHFSGQRSLIRTAVSEGFADLIGFAAHGSLDSDPLSGLPCLVSDRSPMSANFSGGTPKDVSTSLVRQLDAAPRYTVASGFTTNCQGVLPYSAHGLGAIFAYWVRDLAARTPHFQLDPKGTLIEMAISWLQLTEERLGADASESNPQLETQAVGDAIEAMVRKRFASQGEDISEELRAILRQRMQSGFSGIEGAGWFKP